MTLLPVRRADAFAALLDDPTNGPTGDRTGLHTGAVALAERLRTAGPELARTAVPREDFRTALRTRLVAVAAVQPYATPAPPAARRHRRGLVLASGAVASVVAVSGVAVAAGRSLPGDPLYGVKRGTEAMQLRTDSGDLERGRDHLRFAATRLREVRALAEGRRDVTVGPWAAGLLAAGSLSAPRTDRLVRTLAAMDRETEAGRRLLLDAWAAAPGDGRPVVTLARFGAAQQRGLTAVLPLLPPGAHDRALLSLSLATDVATQGAALCAGCATGPTTVVPAGPLGPPAGGTPGASSPASPPAVPHPVPAPVVVPPGAPVPPVQPLPTDAGQQPGTPPGPPVVQPTAPPSLPVPLPTGAPTLPTGAGGPRLPVPALKLVPTVLPEVDLQVS